MPNRHPAHDLVADVVHSWDTTPFPELGYYVERRPFGFYQRHASGRFGKVTVEDVRPDQARALVADVRDYYPRPAGASIMVRDRQVDAVLGPALVEAGCVAGPAEITLAHVGPVPTASEVPGVTIEPVTHANLVEWSTAKLKGFASSEDEPEPDRVRAEVAFQQAEMAGGSGRLLARSEGGPAAIIAWYAGEDRHINLLATRVPFRNRGIARLLLCRVLADAYGHGCRSVVITTDPADSPIQFYRRAGFIDEVYWRRQYDVPPETA